MKETAIKTAHGGVNVPHRKSTKDMPCVRIPVPDTVVIPMQQCIGAPCTPLVKVGDTVDVYVKEVDTEKRKISLGFKNAEDNPWEILKAQYEIGSVVDVTVVSLTSYGAFAKVIPGIDGLIHISQIANERIEKAADVLSIGQQVAAKITAIDFDKKRVSLSIKALLEPVEASEEVVEETAAEEAVAEEAAE